MEALTWRKFTILVFVRWFPVSQRFGNNFVICDVWGHKRWYSIFEMQELLYTWFFHVLQRSLPRDFGAFVECLPTHGGYCPYSNCPQAPRAKIQDGRMWLAVVGCGWYSLGIQARNTSHKPHYIYMQAYHFWVIHIIYILYIYIIYIYIRIIYNTYMYIQYRCVWYTYIYTYMSIYIVIYTYKIIYTWSLQSHLNLDDVLFLP